MHYHHIHHHNFNCVLDRVTKTNEPSVMCREPSLANDRSGIALFRRIGKTQIPVAFLKTFEYGFRDFRKGTLAFVGIKYAQKAWSKAHGRELKLYDFGPMPIQIRGV